MTRNDALFQIKKKFRCEKHPVDKNAIVIFDISLKGFQEVCQRFGCSGHYVEERSMAVATNFGLYK